MKIHNQLLLLFSVMLISQIGLSQSSLPKVNKKFLIQIHVIYDSLGNPSADANLLVAVRAAINGAGPSYFEPLGMSFEAVDEVLYIENFQYFKPSLEASLGVIRSKYDKEKRINLYLVNSYEGELEGGCGYAGDHSVFMAASCVNQSSFAHEMGHIFGLKHTFYPDDELTLERVDGSNCATAGDGICDTPADPFIVGENTSGWIDGCAFLYLGQDASGKYFDPDLGNIMSYYWFSSSCNCGLYFSHDQFQVMADKFFNDLDWW